MAKILNLYAGIGGNRKLWGHDHDITAVEHNEEIASLYQKYYPDDTVIVCDAHQYLLDHLQDGWDFIWSSPPCPTHSRARYWGFGANGKNPVYPDMKLYQEIIFLQHHFNGKYCVENVIPYYNPMLTPQKRGRHLYWCNFKLPHNLNDRRFNVCTGKDEVKGLCEFHDYDFYKYNGSQMLNKIARNLVDYEAGKTILATAMNIQMANKSNQQQLFANA